MRKFSVAVWVAVVLAVAGPALGQFDYSAPLLGTGHDERVDGGTGCPNEADFIAGVYDSVIQLQAGGNGYGCDSEWGCPTWPYMDTNTPAGRWPCLALI